MSLTTLPSGRVRAQVYDPTTKKNVNVAAVLGLPRGTTWASKREAKKAREEARDILYAKETGVTLSDFWTRWTTDPVFARPKESTNIHNLERTKGFVKKYGALEIGAVTHETVSEWLSGGKNKGTVSALRAMFNDAAGPLGPRLIAVNPFSRLGLERSKGRSEQQPPTVEQAQQIILAARRVSCPSFAAWLEVAMGTGMRPGELDALMWDDVDFDGGWINVRRQFNAKTRTFTTPKNGLGRPVPMHGPVRRVLTDLPREGDYCFKGIRGQHWTAQSRAYHWKAVKAGSGWTGSLYLATRHYAGWMMYDQLLLDAEDVAFALGHTDGGELVRRLYGHRDRSAALERVRRAYEALETPPTPLKAVK